MSNTTRTRPIRLPIPAPPSTPEFLKRFYNMPIGRRLALIVVTISTITLVSVVWIALISTTLTLRNETTFTLIRQNRNLADALDRRLESVRQLLNEQVTPSLARAYTPGISVIEMRESLFNVMRLETNLLFQRITVFVPDEFMYVFDFSNPSSGEDILTRNFSLSRIAPESWFIPVAASGQGGWYGPNLDPLQPNNQTLSVVVPLFVNSSAQPIGIVWADISSAEIGVLMRETIAVQGDITESDTERNVTGYSFMIGKEGSITGAYNTRQRRLILDDLLGSNNPTLPIDRMTPIAVSFAANNPALAIASTMPLANWQFVTVLPDSTLPELPYTTVLQIIAVSALGLIALIWTVNRFVGVTVAHPAAELSRAADTIGSGELSHKIPFHFRERGDEIGKMARALEDMRLNLENLYNTLEQRVADRTAQLELARQEAQTSANELRAVYDESLSVVGDHQLQRILKTFVLRILPLLKCDYCGVWLVRTNGEELRLVAHTYPDSTLTNTVVKLGEGMSGRVALTGHPIRVDHYSEYPHRVSLSNVESIERALCIPMIASGQILGAVIAGRNSDGMIFNDQEQRLLTLFTNLVSPVVKNAQLFVQLEDARNAADRANLVKTRFLASVTHELRTPLNLIINNMDFMRIGAFGDVTDEQSQRLDQTIRSAEHLLFLINDLLDVSKIEAGEMQLFIQATEIYPVLTDALDSAEMLLDKNDKRERVTLITHIPSGLPAVPMDARRVRQVLFNLLSNAIKFTLEGEVEFTVTRDTDYLHFRVRDTGIGIPEDQHDRLFEAFERTDNAKQMAIEGTGLGLPISRFLVEQHGGQLTFTSQMGVGSTFMFTLPLAAQPINGKQVRASATQIMKLVAEPETPKSE